LDEERIPPRYSLEYIQSSLVAKIAKSSKHMMAHPNKEHSIFELTDLVISRYCNERNLCFPAEMRIIIKSFILPQPAPNNNTIVLLLGAGGGSALYISI
jgi:hypothetical protein